MSKGKGMKATIEGLNKSFGGGTVGKMKDLDNNEINKFSTQSLKLDEANGGGYPYGRIIEIYGPESSGKTTLAIHAIAEIQRLGQEAALIDAEHAFDPSYAEAIGVNIDELTFSQPDNGEQALEVCAGLVDSGEFSLVVVDSVAALTPKSEIDGEMGDANVGKHARLMSQAMRKLVAMSSRNDCTIIFINQIRMKIGVMFGSPETTTGGNALKFYASQRYDIRRTGSTKDGEEVIANTVKVKVVKNKVAAPFKIALTEIAFGKGILINGEILDIAIELEVAKRSGSWFSYGDIKLGQGRAAVLDLLEDNPELVEDLKKSINIVKSGYQDS